MGRYRVSPIARGEQNLLSDSRTLVRTADSLGRREDEALITVVNELELDCYRLAKQAQDFADMLRRLPHCSVCGHMADMENPHEECAEEQAQQLAMAQSPLPAA
jgi:hypothetical protein